MNLPGNQPPQPEQYNIAGAGRTRQLPNMRLRFVSVSRSAAKHGGGYLI